MRRLIAQDARRATTGLLLAVLLAACSDGSSPGSSPTASPAAVPSQDPAASIDIVAVACQRLAELRVELDLLDGIVLRPANRDELDQAAIKVEVAHQDLIELGLDGLLPDARTTARSLGYRLLDLALAVEDFRTTRRPAVAAAHVRREAAAYRRQMDGLGSLAGCAPPEPASPAPTAMASPVPTA